MKYPKETVELIEKLVAQKQSLAVIAEITGVPKGTAYYYIHRHTEAYQRKIQRWQKKNMPSILAAKRRWWRRHGRTPAQQALHREAQRRWRKLHPEKVNAANIKYKRRRRLKEREARIDEVRRVLGLL